MAKVSQLCNTGAEALSVDNGDIAAHDDALNRNAVWKVGGGQGVGAIHYKAKLTVLVLNLPKGVFVLVGSGAPDVDDAFGAGLAGEFHAIDVGVLAFDLADVLLKTSQAWVQR